MPKRWVRGLQQYPETAEYLKMVLFLLFKPERMHAQGSMPSRRRVGESLTWHTPDLVRVEI